MKILSDYYILITFQSFFVVGCKAKALTYACELLDTISWINAPVHYECKRCASRWKLWISSRCGFAQFWRRWMSSNKTWYPTRNKHLRTLILRCLWKYEAFRRYQTMTKSFRRQRSICQVIPHARYGISCSIYFNVVFILLSLQQCLTF